MGILIDKVRKAFERYDKGDIPGFVRGIADASDVRYAGHRNIVDDEITKCLIERKLERRPRFASELPGSSYRIARDLNMNRMVLERHKQQKEDDIR